MFRIPRIISGVFATLTKICNISSRFTPSALARSGIDLPVAIVGDKEIFILDSQGSLRVSE
jgi:hypothetical protein